MFIYIVVLYQSLSGLDSRCHNLTVVWVEYRVTGTKTWMKERGDINTLTSILSPPSGGSYEVRVTIENNENLSSSSDAKTVTVAGRQRTFCNHFDYLKCHSNGRYISEGSCSLCFIS